MKRILPALAVLLLLVTPAVGQNYDAGWIAYKNGDFQTALDVWRALAQKGDAQSQTALGSMHYRGLGVPHDHSEARRLYLLAAEKGFAIALFNLGLFYSDPDNDQNNVEAYKWFSLAADRGMVEAGWRLGRLSGQMTPDQIAEAQRMARVWREKHPR